MKNRVSPGRGCRVLGAAAFASLVLGCAASPPEPKGPALAPSPSAPAETAAPFAEDDKAWGSFHSSRFFVTLRLPEGKAWRIDDHARPELVAKHDPTRSELHLAIERQPDVVGRAQCEADARKKGRVPSVDLRTVEDRVTVGPEAYDTRVWVALEVSTRGAIRGHLFAFGGMVRSCLFFHYTTEIPSFASERVLSSRLALVRARVLDAIAVDPPRTTSDAELPRAKEGPK
jgi:hypothetical protein